MFEELSDALVLALHFGKVSRGLAFRSLGRGWDWKGGIFPRL